MSGSAGDSPAGVSSCVPLLLQAGNFLSEQPRNAVLGQIDPGLADPKRLADARNRPFSGDAEVEQLVLFFPDALFDALESTFPLALYPSLRDSGRGERRVVGRQAAIKDASGRKQGVNRFSRRPSSTPALLPTK